MIKKINILLLCAVGVMALVKFCGTVAKSVSKASEDEHMVFEVHEEISELAPTVYHLNWYPFFRANVVSHRNGFCLDHLKAVFPRARFETVADVDEGEVFHAALTNDARAVVIVPEGNFACGHARFSESSLGWMSIRLLSSRSSPWRYRDESSLDACAEFYCDEIFSGIPFAERQRKQGRLRVIDVDKIDIYDVLRNNPKAVYIQPCSSNWRSDISNTGSFLLEDFRLSPEVGRVNLYVAVSKLDPAFAEAFMKDFEAGMARIKKSGVQRRNLEYYFPPN